MGNWPPKGEWNSRPIVPLHIAAPLDEGPSVRPSTELDLDDTAFREAVLAISAAVDEDLRHATDPRQVIQAHVQQWAQGRIVQDGPIGFLTQRRLVDAVYDERFDLGVLTPYVEDDQVESIDINGCDEVWITYSDGTLVPGPAVAPTDEHLIKQIQMWALHRSYAPREFSSANPLLNTALRPNHDEEGVGVRLNATMAVGRRPYASIRCHHLVDVTMADLMQFGTINRSLKAFLEAAVLARLNIMISGGTGAGKTTTLRALTSVLDPMERLATLESDYELFLDRLRHRHRNVVALQVRQPNSEGAGAVSLGDLIPHSLRKHIRRIIVGEVRADEITAMFEAMNSGHPGSMCTIHADDAGSVFNRIVMLWTRGAGVHTPPAVIHLHTGETIDLVVHLRMDPITHVRFVSEVIEVLPPADSVLPSRNVIYRATGPGGRGMPSTTPQCLDRLREAGFDPALLDARNAMWEVR